MNTIRLATVLFDTKIASAEIPYFRGSVIRLSEGNALFHNHCAEGFHYAYPLVQYKRIKGCAALMGINQGAEALAELFGGRPSLSFSLGNRQTVMNVAVIRSEKFAVVCDEASRTYAISRWLPRACCRGRCPAPRSCFLVVLSLGPFGRPVHRSV